MYADCGTLVPVDAEVSVAECEQCLRRKTQRRTPGRPPGSRNKPKGVKVPADAPSPEKPLFTQKPQQSLTAPEKVPLSPLFWPPICTDGGIIAS